MAVMSLGWLGSSFEQSETVIFAARHANPLLELFEYCDLLEINGCPATLALKSNTLNLK